MSSSVLSSVMGEVKQKYQKIHGSCIQGVDEVQLTMIAVENFNSEGPWRLNPTCYSSWNRLIETFSWVMQFVNNCRVDKER